MISMTFMFRYTVKQGYSLASKTSYIHLVHRKQNLLHLISFQNILDLENELTSL